MFKNMKIGVRLTLGFSLLVILTVVIIFTALTYLAGLNDNVKLLVGNRFPKTVLSNEMIRGLNEAASVTRNIIMSDDPQQLQVQKDRLKELAGFVTIRLDSLKKIEATEKSKEMLQHYMDVRV
jgi:methyl-accepting chemotaxis protein